MATTSLVERSLELLEEMLGHGPLTAPEIDSVTRRRWREGAWDWDDLATRALTLPSPYRSPGCGLLYDRLRRLERAGRASVLRIPAATRGALWWA